MLLLLTKYSGDKKVIVNTEHMAYISEKFDSSEVHFARNESGTFLKIKETPDQISKMINDHRKLI